MFPDRKNAGKELAKRLADYRGKNAVVLALPRGGVVLGYEVARALGVPLDIVVTRKIGHPGNPEYAVCAIDDGGTMICNKEERAAIDPAWFREEMERQRKEAARRTLLYRGGRQPEALSGKSAIIVDDGIATGLTMRLAVRAVRKQNPARVVVAVPVAPTETVQMLAHEADEVVALLPPEEFVGAVGAHYEHFPQVEDVEVVRLLAEARLS